MRTLPWLEDWWLFLAFPLKVPKLFLVLSQDIDCKKKSNFQKYDI